MDAKLLAIYADIEAYKADMAGMQAANLERRINNQSISYSEQAFSRIAEKIRALARQLRMSPKRQRKATTNLFIHPTYADLATYAKEKDLSAKQIQPFIDFYESKGWIVGRVRMKSWQAAFSGWCRRNDPNLPPVVAEDAIAEVQRLKKDGFIK